MLSVVKIDWPEIQITESTEIEDLTPQTLILRVGPVFNMGKPLYGIWINYKDGDELYGPVLIDMASWKKVNKHIRRRWRDLTWAIYIYFDRMMARLSRLDIRFL